MNHTTSPTARKQWARTVSKALGHSRAHRAVLAHLAYRAGNGQVWNYTLVKIGGELDPPVVEKTVRRALAMFLQQGIITVKRHGSKASEYTLNFEVDITQRVIKMSTYEWTF